MSTKGDPRSSRAESVALLPSLYTTPTTVGKDHRILFQVALTPWGRRARPRWNRPLTGKQAGPARRLFVFCRDEGLGRLPESIRPSITAQVTASCSREARNDVPEKTVHSDIMELTALLGRPCHSVTVHVLEGHFSLSKLLLLTPFCAQRKNSVFLAM